MTLSPRRQWLSYDRLPERSIRLLRLNPNLSELNVGILEVVALDKAPPFYTLSHSWGTQNQHEPVLINDELVPASPSLGGVIPILRALAVESSNLSPPCTYIWIDKICMNQDSVQERSSQVALMADIFSASVRTLIWLGYQPSSNLSAAWSLLDRIAHLHETERNGRGLLEGVSSSIYSKSSHAQFGLPEWEDEAWTELRSLLEVNWFSRIWVVQEVVLSPLEPLIIHVHCLYPWRKIEMAAAWLRRKGYLRLAGMPEQFRNINTMSSLRRATVKWPLDALLSITQIKFRATDQRDKVYALLGLASECSDAGRIPDALKPDYRQDTAHVYQRVARLLLERENATLAIMTRTRGTTGSLTRAQRRHDIAAIPSWSPDWSDFKTFNNGIRTSFAWIHYLGIEDSPHLGYPKHFSAAGGLGVKLHNSEDPAVLRLDGIICAQVSQAISFPHNGLSNQRFGQMLAENISHVWEAATTQIESAADVESWLARFIKTTTADQHRLTERTREQNFKDGTAFLLTLLGRSGDTGPRIFFPERIFVRNDDRVNLMKYLESIAKEGDPEHYIVLARNYCFNRCFILTDSGMMGLGPSDTHENDHVSAILGGDVPYIIRRSSTQWVFVGEAYIEGLMGGEALKECQQGTIMQSVLDII